MRKSNIKHLTLLLVIVVVSLVSCFLFSCGPNPRHTEEPTTYPLEIDSILGIYEFSYYTADMHYKVIGNYNHIQVVNVTKDSLEVEELRYKLEFWNDH